jgi:hypothetical protein
MRKLLLSLFLVILYTGTNVVAQNITRSSLNSFGGVVRNGNLKLSQSLGQPSNIEVFKKNNVRLSQGFQQSSTKFISNNSKLNIKLYPNPSQFNITISFQDSRTSSFSYYIYDSQGRICQFEKNRSSESIQLNQNINAGAYTIRVYSDNKIGVASLIIIP